MERQDTVDAKDFQVVETGLKKKKHVLTAVQMENLRLGRAIACKNRDENAKAKLDKMVD